MLINPLVSPIVLIRGGGDLASGVAFRLHKAGFQIVITELPAPLMVRRKVSFAQAVYDGVCQVEDITGILAASPAEAKKLMSDGKVAVLVDPKAKVSHFFTLSGMVDGRMTKTVSDQKIDMAPCVIGLGPGFTVGANCHAVVETKRGPNLGRVYWQGKAEPNSGLPEPVNGMGMERVLHSPKDGIVATKVHIGDLIEPGTLVASVEGAPILSKIQGVVRGLIKNGTAVTRGMKIGDVDPRGDTRLSFQVSDKALAVGGGVLEALLTFLSRQKIPGETI
jgi:xanthine dehydrogenase accessory factor